MRLRNFIQLFSFRDLRNAILGFSAVIRQATQAEQILQEILLKMNVPV